MGKFLSSQDTFLKTIRILLAGRGEAVIIEESSLRIWEGLGFSSEEEEFILDFGKKNKRCVLAWFPQRAEHQKNIYPHILYRGPWSPGVNESEAVGSFTRYIIK